MHTYYLQQNYKSFEEFENYSETYGLAKRLGFDSAKEAWQENPKVIGSVNPQEYQILEKFIANLNPFIYAYIECMLWTEEEHLREDDENADINIHNLSGEALETIVRDCDKFLAENESLIGDNLEQAGHDFWLTRNGHGVGFWDRDDSVYGEGNGDILTEASEKYKEQYLYIGNNGQIYLE